MIPLLLPYPEIDPIAFTIGPVAVRWYGLAYMFGLLFAWIYVRRLLQTPALWPHQPPIAPDKTDDLLLWVTLGVVVGGNKLDRYNWGPFARYPVNLTQR
jgi:phosphatidylglycerol:prolipoprotein diacylglycerol transferase